MPIIKAKNVQFQIQNKTILKDINFSIEKGEYVGLIGPNGAGKTTLLKLILKLIKPTQGQITTIPKQKIGYVPQTQNQNNHFPISTQEILQTGLAKSYFWLTKKQKQTIHQALQQVELDPQILSKNFQDLSGGQKQRVLIARSLINNPELILFDEPFNGVDQPTQNAIYQLLENLNKKGTTILFVSHDIQTITEKCQRILCLDQTLHEGCHPIHHEFKTKEDCPNPSVAPKENLPIHHHHCSC